jgi:hypothetical protein
MDSIKKTKKNPRRHRALVPLSVRPMVHIPFRYHKIKIVVDLSPPTPGSSWTDWSHTWRREAYLRRVLQKLNLKYPYDSDD